MQSKICIDTLYTYKTTTLLWIQKRVTPIPGFLALLTAEYNIALLAEISYPEPVTVSPLLNLRYCYY